MLFAGATDNGRWMCITARQPSKRPEHPIREPESHSLESDLGHSSDIAEAITFRLGLFLE